jgi:hypothetical protein
VHAPGRRDRRDAVRDDVSAAASPPGEHSGRNACDLAVHCSVAEIFVAEIIPSYLDQPEANKPPALGPEDAHSLARYQRRDYASRLLKNITGVAMAITADDWKTFRAMLIGRGFRIAEDGAGARASAGHEPRRSSRPVAARGRSECHGRMDLRAGPRRRRDLRPRSRSGEATARAPSARWRRRAVGTARHRKFR